jgi:pimeloyl-ACP methyl ester carboxylesterase
MRRWRIALYVAGAIMCVVAAACYFRPIEVVSFATRMHLRLQGEHSHDVVIAGNKIHFREMGTGQPLVLLHGLGGNSLDWAPVMAFYARAGYHVYAIDLLGFGKSDKPDIDYKIEDQVQMLRQFFAQEGISQADLVGWSMGGWVALKFTLENPTAVRRLAVDDAAGVYFHPTFAASVFTPSTPSGVNAFFHLMEPDAKPLPAFLARDVVRIMKSRHGWVISRAANTMMTGKELLGDELAQIKQPVLINWGADDELIPLSSGYEMQKKIPQADLDIYAGCGHLAPVRCSHAVAAKTLEFFAADTPPAGVVQTVAGK